MLKTPSDRVGSCHSQMHKSVENVLPQLISVVTHYDLNYGRIEFLATLPCGELDCVQRGDCGCNAASLLEAISYERSCIRRAHDLAGFCMMPGPATDFTVPRGASLDVIAEICFERRRNTDAC
jgi:hypothetical protein